MRWIAITFGIGAFFAVLAWGNPALAGPHDHAHHAGHVSQTGHAIQQGDAARPRSETGASASRAVFPAFEMAVHAPLSAGRDCADVGVFPCAGGHAACSCAALCHALLALTSVDLPAPPWTLDRVFRTPVRRVVAVQAPPVPPPRG